MAKQVKDQRALVSVQSYVTLRAQNMSNMGAVGAAMAKAAKRS
jgi:hypothetical protein